ncbi:hypothetical protein DH86_00001764 [Scytalidium sp. 3C]|nr:hypothetical protein DH86_00001764 [Scytalidium sp. 3C]
MLINDGIVPEFRGRRASNATAVSRKELTTPARLCPKFSGLDGEAEDQLKPQIKPYLSAISWGRQSTSPDNVPLSNMSVSDAVTEPISDPRSLEKSVSDMKLEDDTTQSSSAAASARNIPAGPLKTPILKPLDGCVPPPAAALTPEQQLKYEKVLETVKGWKEIPSGNGTAGPIAENEIFWLTRECLLRCLRAAKWNTNDAIKRLMDTLIWRREYGVENLTGDYISPENETGKQIILGYDNSGRPCHYLNPGRQNTNPSPRQVQHMVFMLERVLELAPPGQETLALLINFKSNKNRSNTAPGISTGREVLHILQTHYPERMGRALIINVPWVVWGFFKLITPFIDPITKQKLHFNEDMRKHVPPQQLWNEFLGDLEFEYDHSVYWPALLELCAERRAERWERWVKGGKQYGESEMYLKGGDAPSISATPQPDEHKEENGDGAPAEASTKKENADA